MGINNNPLNTGQVVDDYINTSYDVVKYVHDNLDALLALYRLTGSHQAATADPTTRPDGEALEDGDTYFNTDLNVTYTWNESSGQWVAMSDTAISVENITIDATMASTGTITLTDSYTLGIDGISVFIEGLYQISGVNYTETDTHTIDFGAGNLTEGHVLSALIGTVLATPNLGALTYEEEATTTAAQAAGAVFELSTSFPFDTAELSVYINGVRQSQTDYSFDGAAGEVTFLTEYPNENDVIMFAATSGEVGTVSLSGLPTGGSTGEALVKLSDVDGHVGWEDVSALSPSSAEYCPGYTFNYISTTSFSIEGLNVENVFSVGKRLRFTVGATTIYGTILTSTYVTDTTITMSMEDAATFSDSTAYITCIVTNTIGWSPLTTAVMGGVEMTSIATGVVGADQTFVGVGKAGAIVYSTDGVTWSAVASSPTSEEIDQVLYDSAEEVFVCGTATGVMYYSDDGGVTWAAVSTQSKPSLAYRGFAVRSGNIWKPEIGGIYKLSTASLSAGTWSYNNNPDYLIGDNYTSPENTTYHIILYAQDETFRVDYTVADNGSDVTYNTTLALPNGNIITKLVPAVALGYLAFGTNGYIFNEVGYVNPVNNWSATDADFGNSDINDGVYSEFLGIYIVVGDDGKIAYSDDLGVTWSQVSNGFNLENITCVTYNESLKLFVAGGASGTICTSTSGLI